MLIQFNCHNLASKTHYIHLNCVHKNFSAPKYILRDTVKIETIYVCSRVHSSSSLLSGGARERENQLKNLDGNEGGVRRRKWGLTWNFLDGDVDTEHHVSLPHSYRMLEMAGTPNCRSLSSNDFEIFPPKNFFTRPSLFQQRRAH